MGCPEPARATAALASKGVSAMVRCARGPVNELRVHGPTGLKQSARCCGHGGSLVCTADIEAKVCRSTRRLLRSGLGWARSDSHQELNQLRRNSLGADEVGEFDRRAERYLGHSVDAGLRQPARSTFAAPNLHRVHCPQRVPSREVPHGRRRLQGPHDRRGVPRP